MKVLYLTKTKDKGYTSIAVLTDDGKERIVASDVTVEKMQIVNGSLLSEDEESILREEDVLYRARKKALNILAYGDNSRRALYDKLIRAGFSRGTSSEVVSEMVSLGYINEKRILERLILNEVNLNLSGKAKIIPKLIAKGYSRSLVEETVRELSERGEIDFSLSRRRLIAKKLGDSPDPEEVKKLLYKYGY